MNQKTNPILLKTLHRFIAAVEEEYPVRFAYLFGSEARGEAGDLSDLDIAIYFVDQYSQTEQAFIKGYLIELGKKYFNTPIDIVLLDQADLYLRYLIVKDGIPVKDSLDGSRAEFESLTLRTYFDFQYYADIYNRAIIESIKNQTYFGDSNGR